LLPATVVMLQCTIESDPGAWRFCKWVIVCLCYYSV
jgi:hypothetical protein